MTKEVIQVTSPLAVYIGLVTVTHMIIKLLNKYIPRTNLYRYIMQKLKYGRSTQTSKDQKVGFLTKFMTNNHEQGGKCKGK